MPSEKIVMRSKLVIIVINKNNPFPYSNNALLNCLLL